MKRLKFLFALLVILAAILFQRQLDIFFKQLNLKYFVNSKISVFTDEQLSKYNGFDHERLYLSFLGNIYDVTEGKRHYEQGAPYNYFVGRDGSRSFITGDFKDTSTNKDHILDLTCNELNTLIDWKKTLADKYGFVGVLNGRYYNEYGEETKYTLELNNRLQQCAAEKHLMDVENSQFPPCNSEWNAELGTRLWCSKKSGGMLRNWVGVPRQLFSPGETKPRVCVDSTKKYPGKNLKEYEKCEPTSYSCTLKI